MKKILEIIKEIFFPAFIGVIVGTFYLMVLLSKYIGIKSIIISTVLSALIGVTIGLSAKFIFILFKKNVIKRAKTAYFIETLVIFSLSIIFSYLMGVKELKHLITMAFIALFFTFLFTNKNCQDFIKTNNKLKEIQRKLEKDI